MCEMVYDIEVAQNHNFFAEGALVHNCMVRRLKKDVLPDLPRKLRRVVEFSPSGEMLEIVKQQRATSRFPEAARRITRSQMSISQRKAQRESKRRSGKAVTSESRLGGPGRFRS